MARISEKRKTFLEELPKKKRGDKKIIDWKASAGFKIRFMYDDIEDYVEIIKYNSKTRKLSIKYKDKTDELKTDVFTKGHLGKILGRVTNEFKIEVGQMFKDNKRDIIIVDREYREKETVSDENNKIYISKKKWYKYKCNKCPYQGWMIESSLLNGCGCSCCCTPPKTAVLGINTIWDTDRWMCDLGVSEEDAKSNFKGSGKKVKIICPNCGKEKYKKLVDIYSEKSIGCTCGDGYSQGHKYIHEMLTQLNIDFIDNYKPKWCSYHNEYKNKECTGEYDFVIKSKKIIIEVDGEFHRSDNKMNKQSKEESQYIDSMKDKLAKDNGYKVIRIPYNIGDFKDNILNSELATIFDIKNIDWKSCETYSLKNLIKEVCSYWGNKEQDESIRDVAKRFTLSETTTKEYLRKGIELNWCNYNPEEEIKKNIIKSVERNKRNFGKKVEIYRDDVLLGVFESVNELERQSNDVFNTKLYISAISKVINGKQKHHKGYTFKYVS